ncbi:hypothetical protein [Sphingosinicella microcystinivorans]|uniref:baeRF11 domain-containing protein n=1 Tax=Sphingosinicella microcystinivorans TaxID=335406 RepID=UPI0022F3DE67|nr:hypothetical protein [Sphingosinicella microcystinivorans]WBX82901.1 hypothetical protein PE061_13875 [Sphingosinicella microcystinivorans]
MLYIDLPTRAEFSLLAGLRTDACISIYLKTTPVTPDTDASRIELGNLLREAGRQLEENGHSKKQLALLLDPLHDLIDDDDFWRYQANSLAIFATADTLRTYRLANNLTSMVQVSDRPHLKPLFRAITFPHSALILAFSENAVRLVEIHPDLPPTIVKVPDLPKSAASALGKSTLNDRSFSRRIHGSEGQNVRFQQYARYVDAALRGVLAGREIPLILAATGRLASVFRQVNSYPHLLSETIADSPDRLTETELADLARPILDRAYAGQIAQARVLFEKRSNEGRSTTDIADAARAATFGGIDTILFDFDAVVPGFVDDENGTVEFVEVDDARAYGIVDEIVTRAFATGAHVLAVRKEDLQSGATLAAILRQPI